ncbi:glycosyltransferase [Patescibacteria group bacterium]|nr:glycosyltransferase [Patescibacteria group bacterium]
MTHSPRISIIIPTLREAPFIGRTLEILRQIEMPHQIIVSDGGSTDGTLDIAAKYTENIVVWTHPQRQTFGQAKNAGAALATGEFLVFIDADVHIPSPQSFFETMLSVFDADPKLLAMTVPLKPWEDNRSWVDALFCTPLNAYYIIANNVFHSGNASGEFQMIRREPFRRIGGYHEKLAAGEDNEIFRQLAIHGRTLSYSRLCVRHSLRRPHKLGWLRTYGIWLKNGFSIALRGRSAYKEWSVVR